MDAVAGPPFKSKIGAFKISAALSSDAKNAGSGGDPETGGDWLAARALIAMGYANFRPIKGSS
jgi:hypothetical protein